MMSVTLFFEAHVPVVNFPFDADSPDTYQAYEVLPADCYHQWPAAPQ